MKRYITARVRHLTTNLTTNMQHKERVLLDYRADLQTSLTIKSKENYTQHVKTITKNSDDLIKSLGPVQSMVGRENVGSVTPALE